MIHGWLVLDKPLGLGSTQAVSAVKRVLRAGGYAKVKVGHGGTLDPLATGVLPIAIGEATKLAGRMLDSDKAYDFTIRFGVQTDTLDAEGATVATSDRRPDAAAVETVLARFTGAIAQVPPAYSALKIEGQRAYDLARAGVEVEPPTRAVTVHSLRSSPARGGGPRSQGVVEGACGERRAFGSPPPPSLRDGSPPRAGEELEEVALAAHVSKGTYIRSLARDIALALGTVGHVTMLRRTRAGPFGLAQAISLDKLTEFGQRAALEEILLPLSAGLDDIPALPLTSDQAGALRQGRVLDGVQAADGVTFAMHDAAPVALVEVDRGMVRVVRGFNL